MSGLILTITDAGRAALVNATNTGTNPVLMASVGLSATAFTPSPATNSLPGEIKRISTIAGEAVADDTIHVTVRDESADVYTVRSFGLYLDDGTLFAVYSQPNPIMEKSAQAMLLLAIDVTFADIDATDITFGDTGFLNPPATTERQGIVELATEDETTSGSDATRVVTPKGLKAAVTSWLNTRFGEGAPSNFVKGLLTSASAAALRTALGLKSAALKDEGAGKGLDADLLDGQQGSFYQNASNLNAGTVPAARLSGTYGISISGNADTSTKLATARTLSLTGDVTGSASFDGSANAAISATLTAAKVREKLLTVDGSGSGVDADMLDGLHGDQFMRSDTTAATVGFYNPTAATDLNAVARLSYRAVIPIHSAFQPDNRPANNYVSGIEFGAYLENYRWQLVAAFPTANRFFARLLNAGTWQDWVEFWHTGNDGSGSGLDADLLDGQHGSFYQNANNLNAGTVPAARLSGTYSISVSGNAGTATKLATARTLSLTGDVTGSASFDGSANAAIAATLSAAKVLEKLVTVDGSGSGVDADMLDGLHGDQFMRSDTTAATVGLYNPTAATDLNTIGRLSYRAVIPFNSGYQANNRPVGNYVSGLEFGSNLENYRWQLVAAFPAANRFFARHLNAGTWQDWVEFWHTGNDGSGSGLDADLLDGEHANAFVKQTDFTGSNQSLGLNGYQKLPGGLIIQAGQVSVGANATAVVTWPIAFPNRCIAAVCSGGETDAGREHNPPAFYAWGPTSGSIFNAIDTAIATRWIAIGH